MFSCYMCLLITCDVTKEEEVNETEEIKTYLDKFINSPLVSENGGLPVLVQLKMAGKLSQ